MSRHFQSNTHAYWIEKEAVNASRDKEKPDPTIELLFLTVSDAKEILLESLSHCLK